jgi:cysteine rich repeat protein
MLRIAVLTVALGVAIVPAAQAQSSSDRGNAQERTACHPDVVKFCQTQLQVNPNDLGGILNCLQTNRANISTACQKVLASHGQ